MYLAATVKPEQLLHQQVVFDLFNYATKMQYIHQELRLVWLHVVVSWCRTSDLDLQIQFRPLT